MTYAWTKDGNPITETTARLVIDPAQLSDAGTYTVVVTNSLGSVTSNAAILTVNPALVPTITTQPVSQTVTVGQPVTFTVAATGNTRLSYQWRKDVVPLTGDTIATKAITSVQVTDAGAYTVVVKNVVGDSVTSATATLTVNAKEEKKNCGCGSGTGLALIPPLFFKAMALRKRKKKNPKT
jgi:hypothetical protein